MKTQREKFFKILATEGDAEATILLYGYIGEYYEWDDESERWKIGGVTDIEFVQELNRLASTHKTIHIRLNSPGGDFYHGNAIMTAIQTCAAEVHTWNDGVAASMAADIWMCGHRRHMAKNAVLMVHPTWSICAGNAAEMRECADFLDKLSNAAIIATAASTGISEDEMRRRYYADYKDHWLTYADAVADGLVNETGEEYESADLPKAVEKMTYKQLIEHFHKHHNPEAPGLMDRVRELYNETLSSIQAAFAGKSAKPALPQQPSTQTNTLDMNLDDFKKSLEEKTLDIEAVKTILAALDTPPTPAADPQQDDLAAAVKTLTDDLAALKADYQAVVKKLEEYAPLPGASKSTPPMPSGDPAGVDPLPDALKEFNEAAMQAAQSGQIPYRPTA